MRRKSPRRSQVARAANGISFAGGARRASARPISSDWSAPCRRAGTGAQEPRLLLCSAGHCRHRRNLDCALVHGRSRRPRRVPSQCGFGTTEAVFLSTRLVEDRFGLAFEFFINVAHNFADVAGVPESFAQLVWSQAEAQVRGETSQDAWEARRRAQDSHNGQVKTIDERSRTTFYESCILRRAGDLHAFARGRF